ncbi:MAG TPA: AraC family transcriptional regulator [Longimicrobium sp.]|nr:AraC family transcriptional regulator [Longimicrobium sp.]
MRIDAGGLRMVVTDYLPGERMAPHWHPGTQVSMVLRGAVEEGVGGREHQGTAGAVVVKPAGTVHRNVFGPATVRMLSINILPGAGGDADDRLAALESWRWMEGGPASRALWRLLSTARAEPGTAPSLLADGFWEMVDALDVYAAPPPSPSAAPAWLCRVRDHLHDCAGAAPPVRDLAGAAGVHPVYLARAFRRAYGVPVTEYARRLRLRAAADRIASTALPLARIACEAGFADQAHLTRELRRETGLTPGALRRAAATPPIQASPAVA